MDRRQFVAASAALASSPALAVPAAPHGPDRPFEIYRHIPPDGSWEDREVPPGWRLKSFGIHSDADVPLFDVGSLAVTCVGGDFGFVTSSIEGILGRGSAARKLLPNAAIGLCFLMSGGRSWISNEKLWVVPDLVTHGRWDVLARAVDLRTLQALHGARDEGICATRLEGARLRRELRMLIRGVVVHFVGRPF